MEDDVARLAQVVSAAQATVFVLDEAGLALTRIW
jgi:hypothetical protein